MSGLGGMLIPILLLVVFYFLLIVPQRKREKKQKELVNSVQVGNNIVTRSGILGKVINVDDDKLVIETSIEKSQLEIAKWAILDILQNPQSSQS